MSESKALLIASKEFAAEHVGQSWWHLLSTMAALGSLLAITLLDLPLLVRLGASILAGLVLVRMFILYHDFEHGAILGGSPVARAIMFLYGILAINPRSVWNRSHDHHHKNNSKIFGANIGSYPLMTTETYLNASGWERFRYAASRHPVTIAMGYLTIFLYGMCLRPVLLNPKRHADCGLALLVHIGLICWAAWIGWDVLLLTVFIPFFIAASMGAYLFYAQHNFPDARLRKRGDWSHVYAALHSSSYIEMGPFLRWFTGNIGYHHVHHLNAKIPFYRLPEAMARIKELQSPGTTSLKPRDIANCLRLKLWDAEKNRLVTFRESRATTSQQSAC